MYTHNWGKIPENFARNLNKYLILIKILIFLSP